VHLALGVNPSEWAGGGAVEHVSVEVEARSVAWAIPGLLGIVEANDAAEMGAGRLHHPEVALAVASNGDEGSIDATDAPLAGLEVGRWVAFAVGLEAVSDEVRHDVGGGGEELAGDSRENPGRVVRV